MPTPLRLKLEAARLFPGELSDAPSRAAEAAAETAEECSSADGAPLLIFDTNVALDIVYWRNPEALPFMAALEAGRTRAAVDLDAALELAEVLSRKQFGLSEDEALSRWRSWMAVCRRIPKTVIAPAAAACGVRCLDPLDQKFLTLALAADADAIVTRDKLVLKAGRRMMKRYGIPAMTPAAAAAFLAPAAGAEALSR